MSMILCAHCKPLPPLCNLSETTCGVASHANPRATSMQPVYIFLFYLSIGKWTYSVSLTHESCKTSLVCTCNKLYLRQICIFWNYQEIASNECLLFTLKIFVIIGKTPKAIFHSNKTTYINRWR